MELDCQFCGKQQHQVKRWIWNLPDVLIVQLKRFSFDNEKQESSKDFRLVKFDVRNLNLEPYIHEDAKEGRPTLKYSLYAIVVGRIFLQIEQITHRNNGFTGSHWKEFGAWPLHSAREGLAYSGQQGHWGCMATIR